LLTTAVSMIISWSNLMARRSFSSLQIWISSDVLKPDLHAPMPNNDCIWAYKHASCCSNRMYVHDCFIQISRLDPGKACIEVSEIDISAYLSICNLIRTHSIGTDCRTNSSSNIVPFSSTIVALARLTPAVVSTGYQC
jgi:hypothetical protein